MKPLGDPLSHFWLVQDMARTADVDLSGLRASGRLSAEDWAQMVTRCRGCAWTKDCKRWLAATQDDAEVPPACANRAAFDALRAGQ